MPSWLEALNRAPPCGSFGEARGVRRRIEREFGGDPAYRAFADAVLRWQTDFAWCAEIRRSAEALIQGRDGHADAGHLLGAIADAGPVGPPLFRGYAEPFPYWEVLSRYAPGAHLDLPVVSFSTDHLRATEFAWSTYEEGGTEVVLILREGANAVRIDLLAPDEIHWREREWITGGRFVVASAEYRHDAGRAEVQLTQEGYFDVR